jgi:hypothetical protein
MKIQKIAYNAHNIEKLYNHINKALKEISLDHIGKTKNELKSAKKELERIRPHLKNKGK